MLDSNKIFRIGIDWLTLYNFEIKFNKNFVAQRVTEDYYQEKFFLDEPCYTIECTNRLYLDGKETSFKNLRFNPNKIINGHNVYNSREKEIAEAIKILKEDLAQKGIELDLKDAKIKDIEINLNFNKAFSELKEALELIFISTPHLKKISGFTGERSYKDLFQDESLFGNYSTMLVTAYDKNKESKIKIKECVTRLEWRFIKKSFSNFTKQKKLDNRLDTILSNFYLIDEIFLINTKTKLMKTGVDYLENVLKKNLEIEYLSFKKNNKLGKELGKKEKRGVFKFLEDTCWVFDYAFLIELVDKYDKPHKSRETKSIKKNFSMHNNLEKLNYLMEIIFNH